MPPGDSIVVECSGTGQARGDKESPWGGNGKARLDQAGMGSISNFTKVFSEELVTLLRNVRTRVARRLLRLMVWQTHDTSLRKKGSGVAFIYLWQPVLEGLL